MSHTRLPGGDDSWICRFDPTLRHTIRVQTSCSNHRRGSGYPCRSRGLAFTPSNEITSHCPHKRENTHPGPVVADDHFPAATVHSSEHHVCVYGTETVSEENLSNLDVPYPPPTDEDDDSVAFERLSSVGRHQTARPTMCGRAAGAE